MTDFAYDGPIFLVPLSPSYPSSPVLSVILVVNMVYGKTSVFLFNTSSYTLLESVVRPDTHPYASVSHEGQQGVWLSNSCKNQASELSNKIFVSIFLKASISGKY